MLGDLFGRPRSATSISNGRSSSRRSSRIYDERGRKINLDDHRAQARLGRPPARLSASSGRCATSQRFSRRRRARATSRASTAPRNMVLASPARVDARRDRRQRARGVRARARAAARREPPAPRPAGARAALPRTCTTRRRRPSCTSLFHAPPRARSRLPGAASRCCACSTTACRPGSTTRLADQKGLAYSIDAAIEPLVQTPPCSRSTRACAHAKLPALVRELLALLGRLPRRAGRADELGRPSAAIAMRRSSRRYDDLDGLCRLVRRHRAVLAAPTRRRSGPRRWRGCAPRTFATVARRVLRPERLSVTVVGSLAPTLVAQGREASSAISARLG